MENTNYNEPQPDENDWQQVDQNENANTAITDFSESVPKQYATDDREDDDIDDDRDDDDDETDENDDDDTAGDWGTVDPLEHPGPPSDMDPSAPGSAV